MLLTFQMVTLFVPPWIESWNCCGVATLTETVAGEIVTLMLVTGSVQVLVELFVAVVDVEVVQVIAVLVGAAPHEASASRTTGKIISERYFTAPLPLLIEFPNSFDSASTVIPSL
jgi:hypothetical protein